MPTAVEHLREASTPTPPTFPGRQSRSSDQNAFLILLPTRQIHPSTELQYLCPLPFRLRIQITVGTPYKSSPFTQFPNLYFTQAIYPKTHCMNLLALLQAGDVHPNPGPLEDLLQIIAEQNHTPSFNIPHINLYPQQTFDFESF